MAEVLLSPGVLARENDNSFLTAQPIQAGAAILGPTVKGPVGIPTIVTTYSDYKNVFGAVVESGSDEYTYFTSVAAYNYFQQGGDSLLVTRVVSGSYSEATSSIANADSSVAGTYATGSILESLIPGGTGGIEYGVKFDTTAGATHIFVSSSTPTPDYPGINTYSFTGGMSGLVTEINTSASAYYSASLDGSTVHVTSSISTGNGTTLQSGSFIALLGGAGVQFGTLSGGTAGTSATALEIETLSEGVIQNSAGTEGAAGQLSNGTRENIRWEVVNSDTTAGTFNILVRRGDDITNSKTVLETWTNLSMDPNSSNYVSRVIGDQKQEVTSDAGTYYVKTTGTYANASRYIRIKSVSSKTLNYFDNAGTAKSEYTSSIPVAASGAMGGATGTAFATVAGNFNENIGTDTQGLVGANYDDSISLLANKDEYNYNLIVAPGLTKEDHSSQITSIVDNSQQRGDAIAVVDMVNYNDTITGVTGQAAGIDSSYAATYWPWVQTIDPDLGDQVWVPASAMIPGVYAFNDNSSEAWFAPAGLNRGGLSTVIRAERKLTNGNRDTLYQGNVNPIATFPNTGVVVFGQKTLQKRASALDRVNVRRLLITLKSYISQVADNLVFEQNTIATRNNFLAQVNPYLESVQQRQGLYAFKVVMDDSNNTPDVIDRNQMVGQIYIQPTRTAEFIYLDFNILPTGATFPS
jgi:phage tail sheath protein FI